MADPNDDDEEIEAGFTCSDDQAAIYELAFKEGIRVLDEQAATREQLRVRIAAILATATTGTAFLVGVVARAKTPDQDWLYWSGVALGSTLYGVLLICAVVLLRPKQPWRLNSSPAVLVGGYAEGDPPATLPETHRNLALFSEENIDANQATIVRMQTWLGRALIVVILELVTWGLLVVKVG